MAQKLHLSQGALHNDTSYDFCTGFFSIRDVLVEPDLPSIRLLFYTTSIEEVTVSDLQHFSMSSRCAVEVG